MDGALVGGSRLVMAGLLAGTRFFFLPQNKMTITMTFTKTMTMTATKKQRANLFVIIFIVFCFVPGELIIDIAIITKILVT